MICSCVAPAASWFTQPSSSLSEPEGGSGLLRPRYLLKNCATRTRRYSVLRSTAKATVARVVRPALSWATMLAAPESPDELRRSKVWYSLSIQAALELPVPLVG